MSLWGKSREDVSELGTDSLESVFFQHAVSLVSSIPLCHACSDRSNSSKDDLTNVGTVVDPGASDTVGPMEMAVWIPLRVHAVSDVANRVRIYFPQYGRTIGSRSDK